MICTFDHSTQGRWSKWSGSQHKLGSGCVWWQTSSRGTQDSGNYKETGANKMFSAVHSWLWFWADKNCDSDTITLVISVGCLLWSPPNLIFSEWRSSCLSTDRFARQQACSKQRGFAFKYLQHFSVFSMSVCLFQYTDIQLSNFTATLGLISVYYQIYVVRLRTTRNSQQMYI